MGPSSFLARAFGFWLWSFSLPILKFSACASMVVEEKEAARLFFLSLSLGEERGGG